MKKYVLSALLIAMCVSVIFTVPVSSSSGTDGFIRNTDDIIDAVLKHFTKLAVIPRPSGHEENVSRYLYEYAEGKGLKPVRDKSNNVIVDIPATPGLEKLPKVALQGHMDMVCVADHDGYDPENDPIEVVRESDTIHAKGTSLGADDGIGVAIILCVMDGLMPHGPVRAIFTTDEEVNMSGASNLDPSHLADCPYLINLDGEDSDVITLGCASYCETEITSPVETVRPEGDKSVTLRISGLKGGHSALLINTDHLSAVKVLIALLYTFRNNGLSFELASFAGGTAANVIPYKAECELVISGKDTDKYRAIIERYQNVFRSDYADVEPDMKIGFTENERLPEKVFTAGCTEKFFDSANLIPDGVLAANFSNPNTPEISANLGVVKASPEGISFVSSLRGATESDTVRALSMQRKIIELNGLTSNIRTSSPVWEYSENNPLRDLYGKAFKKQNGRQPKQEVTHASLECAMFVRSSPGIQMIAIGPDIDCAHSVRETCNLIGVVTVWRALAETLAHIDECVKASSAPTV